MTPDVEKAKQATEQAAARVDAFRERHPRLDHLVRTWQHYGEVKGNLQAGGVTYFGFLSFFPILALAFFVVGWASKVYDRAQTDLVDAISVVLPDLVSVDGAGGTISLQSIQDNAAPVGWIGLAGVLFAGLGWLSAMRDALLAMFDKQPGDQPNVVLGKARDLLTLVLIGLVLIVSVAISSVISGFSAEILDWLGLGAGLDWGLKAITVVVGLLASMVLFYAMFRLLAAPDAPAKALWSGALFGAVGFEILKRLAGLLMASTKAQPAFQAFGIALVLLVWIYYFSRVVLYAAAWAHTAPSARRAREASQEPAAAPDTPTTAPSVVAVPTSTPKTDGEGLAARVELSRRDPASVIAAAAMARDLEAARPVIRRGPDARAVFVAGALAGAAAGVVAARRR